MDLILTWCRENPAWIFLAIAILPGFAIPSSPLLILAGITWGTTPKSCALALAAVAINIIWSHLLAAGPARKLLTRILGPRLIRFQTQSRADHIRLATLVRFTPGVPLCVQNYALGLLGVPLRTSLAIAIPTTAVHVCGLVLTGGAIFEGRLGTLLLGISLILIATIAIHFIRRKIATQK
jgi:uncharacterized membrane protein YdjX (TVP38/TMEM64 family)